ncbi:MAG: alanine--tRNA ligase, partial [Acidobacteriota bacterium]|nr:alanine--tRNA ligase [Acidobacteriota bacterium]
MRNLSGSQIREEFLRFFEGKGHRRVHSASLVPVNDPTLLFTNAGMNQFKDVFLGAERRDYTRAVSAQKCVRAGGKHNDLENGGFTRRHHTFFEMLGNFSFGDYFKREAIAYAWELLTSPDWFGIDPARLYVTIFEGDAAVPRDDEAFAFWREVGVPAERIVAMGAKDNFWAMGDTGPCGPCSEIYFDLGLAASESGEDKPFGEDEQRYMEIWNLVFMQFDRVIDPKTGDGMLTPLPKPSIDTGMGLERVACVLQGKLSNYESDLFTSLLAAAAQFTGVGVDLPPEEHIADLALSDEKTAASLRIIADHARAATFLIADGLIPGSGYREYPLRKILRRAIWHGRLLGREKPFMHDMVLAVVGEMQVAYPELLLSADHVAQVVLSEERQFGRILGLGAEKLERYFEESRSVPPEVLRNDNLANAYLNSVESSLSRASYRSTVTRFLEFIDDEGPQLKSAGPDTIENFIQHFQKELKDSSQDVYRSQLNGFLDFVKVTPEMPEYVLQGRAAFRYYETFGLPQDFIEDAARDAGFCFDQLGFERAKEEEQQRARASWKGGSQKSAAPVYRELAKTEFEGYSALRVDGTRMIALVKDGVGVSELRAGEVGEVVLDATSFYADSGGQVGDVGWLYGADHNVVVADVTGCRKPVQG